MKRKLLTTLLLLTVLITTSSCESDSPNNKLEDVLNEQYGDIFNGYLNDDLQDTTSTDDTKWSKR